MPNKRRKQQFCWQKKTHPSIMIAKKFKKKIAHPILLFRTTDAENGKGSAGLFGTDHATRNAVEGKLIAVCYATDIRM